MKEKKIKRLKILKLALNKNSQNVLLKQSFKILDKKIIIFLFLIQKINHNLSEIFTYFLIYINKEMTFVFQFTFINFIEFNKNFYQITN